MITGDVGKGTAALELTRPMKTVIAHRSSFVTDSLRDWLGSSAGVEVVADCYSAIEAVGAIERHRPDLALIDVEIPRADVLGKLDGKTCVVAWLLTKEHAEFEFPAHDLWMVVQGSNTKGEAIPELISSVKARLEQKRRGMSGDLLKLVTGRAPLRTYENLAFKWGERLIVKPVDDVSLLVSESFGTRVVSGRESYSTLYPLVLFGPLLRPDEFFRVNARVWINLTKIKRITLAGRVCDLELNDGTHLGVARNSVEELKRSMAIPSRLGAGINAFRQR